MTEKNVSQPPQNQDTSAFSIPDDSKGFRLAEASCWLLLEKQAQDVVILDLRGSSDVCDFFVLAEGNSDTQVRALARNLRDRLLDAGQKPRNVEGMEKGRWVLMDYFDVVIHVFQGDTRRYYQLEHLWNDARRLDLTPDWFRDPQVADRHPDLKFTFASAAEIQGS